MSDLKLTIKGMADLRKQLRAGSKYLFEKEMRGVVAVAANEIRDQAIANANAVGLGQSGSVTDASGRVRQRQGKIPSAIYAFVEPNKGLKVSAKVAIERTPETFHVGFVEFGTRFRAPTPFFRRAAQEAAGKAYSAAEDRFYEAVNRFWKR